MNPPPRPRRRRTPGPMTSTQWRTKMTIRPDHWRRRGSTGISSIAPAAVPAGERSLATVTPIQQPAAAQVARLWRELVFAPATSTRGIARKAGLTTANAIDRILSLPREGYVATFAVMSTTGARGSGESGPLRFWQSLVQPCPTDLAACEVCGRLECSNAEWIACHLRRAAAHCLETGDASLLQQLRQSSRTEATPIGGPADGRPCLQAAPASAASPSN